MHINPDHFLQTERGRVIDAKRNKVAWQRAYQAFAEALMADPKPSRVYLLVGAQGAGKSTWAKATLLAEPGIVIFDAIRVTRAEREPLIQCANRYGVAVVAVLFPTSLNDCLTRNRLRCHDEKVPEQAIRNVYAALEPPHVDEGFSVVLIANT